MFEIGFSEILLIVVIALVVVGPQKLPRIAAQVGRWVGRARNMARQFREQLESEVDLDRAASWAENKKPAAAAAAPAAAAAATGAAATDAASDTASVPPEPAPVYPYTDHQPDTTDDTYSHAHASGGVMEDSTPAPVEPPLYSDTAPPYAAAAAPAVPDGEQVDWVSAQNGAAPHAEPVAVSTSSQQFVVDTHEGLHEDHHAPR